MLLLHGSPGIGLMWRAQREAFDPICSTAGNRQGDPMRGARADLTVVDAPAGQSLPHIAAVRDWLRDKGL